MKTFATLIDEVQASLSDDGTKFTDALVTIKLEDALREVSLLRPFMEKRKFELESRTGAATSTLSTWLVDSSAQFVAATDVGKVIYNTTDRTWAKVISNGANSTTQLNLSKDIMASGESYEMFNENCWTNKQIYLGDISDYIGDNHGVEKVVYRSLYDPQEERNFTVEGDILTLDINFDPPDSSSATADVEVYVWLRRKHQVTQQSITTLYIDKGAGYSAGDTAILVDYDGGAVTGTIKEGTNFTIHETRGVYIVTADATFSGNEVTLQIFPALENDIADDKTVWLLKSSLDYWLETVVVELTAGRSLISKAPNLVDAVNVGGPSVPDRYEAEGQRMVASALMKLKSGLPPKMSRLYSKTKD